MALSLFFIYIIAILVILYHEIKTPIFETVSAAFLILITCFTDLHWFPLVLLWVFIALTIVTIHVEPVRQTISSWLFRHAGKSIPKLTKTEEEALNAGDTWLEQDIFTGTPNWERLAEVSSDLTEEEQAFLENETSTLCGMLDVWSISQDNDLPENVWSFMKEKGFFGLVIEKKYGGKGFSARAHSDIVMKIASRSGVAAVTCMVPNSLGPGELLQYYGTEEQKQQYLPNLASGKDIPCFALTEPMAGSDATSIQSEAVVTCKKINGKEVLGLTINHLNKRWITLAPVATLIGLAVNLKDPDGLLQGVGSEGITCVLIPNTVKNLEIGNRHIPADQPFMNGTIRGHDIFVPISSIIGGQKNAGQGWQMLVECLSIGRSISLPALAAASSSIAYITTGAFARIRRQFNTEIAQFEGIKEKLAEIAGINYLINATRLLTIAAVNEHKKPSVASAITKYFNTELARVVVNDAMDVHAGRAVVTGPRNYLTGMYSSLPISITVEGANIMSRNLLIFGQGSMACHPYIREEFYAVAREDKSAFHLALWSHINYFMKNFAKTVCSVWTGGVFIAVPRSDLAMEYKRLARLSHAFAWLADFCLIYLGGGLKRSERTSARLADSLSYLYMAMAVLRVYQQQEAHADERVHAKWALRFCFYQAQQAMIGVCNNFPSRFMGGLMRLVAFPFGQTVRRPTDRMDNVLSMLMTSNNNYRERLKKWIFFSGNPKEPVDKVEHALQLLIANQPLYDKITDLKRCSMDIFKHKLIEKVRTGILTEQEMDDLVAVERARWDAIQVDEFDASMMRQHKFNSLIDSYKNPLD